MVGNGQVSGLGRQRPAEPWTMTLNDMVCGARGKIGKSSVVSAMGMFKHDRH
jgi:hypothetical protein